MARPRQGDCPWTGVRIGHHPPNLTLWLFREAEYIERYQPALLPPCPCAGAEGEAAPLRDTCDLSARPAETAVADAPARPHEPADRPQPPVAPVAPPELPAAESTDPPTVPTSTGAVGNFLDVFV